MGLIPGWGTKIQQASEPKKKKKKEREEKRKRGKGAGGRAE